ncbi:hypothetical protein L211DRAFT_129864 [Terfezia boudieri ATCC MYA-4762]|uniref:CBF1-interacting co-repressor CIR N-terminal domain-containing protein n=1 Tax=Terfezia boudieri ATCC MYA-4762 TaxID=1051890 RepID=A0A3N4LPT4_9PEZI|nr:hypothetical protein L211DRAFT_129864 [Terfezia boudieri ATCC MYA-4762]
MPLHLLPKKSWNVYNADNIERVRHDEEIARKKEEEEETKMQQEDAERRMMELRKRALERQSGTVSSVGGGEGGGKLLTGSVSEESSMDSSGIKGNKAERRDALYATGGANRSGSTFHMQERQGYREDSFITPQVHKSLTDKSGHINFFAEHLSGPRKLSNPEKNLEHEKEKAEKEAKIAEQFNMALGKSAGELRPWYVNVDKVGEKQERRTEKQVEIEKRRDEKFKNINDPMAVMRRGVRQLKGVEEARKRIERERKYELERLKMEDEELEGFCLNKPPTAQDHSSMLQLDSSRNGRLGKGKRQRNRSSDYRPSKHKHRQSRSPESSSDTAKKNSKRRHKDRCYSRDRDQRGERNRDLDGNGKSGFKRHRRSGSDRRGRTQGRDRRPGWIEDRNGRASLKGKEHCGEGRLEHGSGLGFN